jgi:protein-arginine kinase activator protein McsA
MASVTCNGCGWVHGEISRAEAEAHVANYNAFLRSLEPEQRKNWPERPAFIEDYERCDRCDTSYRDFRDFRKGDCPDGCTTPAIIRRTE